MGNVISRCTHGVSIALQKCRSQKKSTEEGKLKEKMNHTDLCEMMQKWDERQGAANNGQQVRTIPATTANAFEDHPVKYLDSGRKNSSACNGIQCRNTKEDSPSRENFQHTDEEGCATQKIRALVERQEKVLEDLQALQRTVQTLAEQKGVDLSALVESSAGPAQNPCSVATGLPPEQSPLQVGKLHEVVVNIDPSSVPLSLLVLLKQLVSQYKILTNTYVHSSALDTPENLRKFVQNGVQQGSRSDYQLSLSIIWKKGLGGPRLMVSPTRQTSIRGEANVARYLARLLQPAYDEGDIITATQIDELLDLAELQVIGGNNKERAAALRTLNSRLGKAQWLVGSQPSLADVLVWSALQSSHLAVDAPANVKKWLKGCEELAWFQQALQFRSS